MEAIIPLSIADAIVYSNMKSSREYGTDRRDLTSINTLRNLYFPIATGNSFFSAQDILRFNLPLMIL